MAASLTLEIVEGPDAGRTIPLSSPVEVGREQGVTLVLGDDLVSRRHARITPAPGGVTVEDLGSSNGTFINGNELHAPTFATPGDQILVGVSVLEIRSPKQVKERPSAVRPVPPALAQAPARPDYLPPHLQSAADAAAGVPPAPPQFAPPQQGSPPQSPPAPVGRKPEVPIPELDPLLDVYTKKRALLAPLAIGVFVVLALIIFLATR